MKSAERIERISLLKRQAELIKQSIGTDPTATTQYYEVLQEITKLQRIEAGFHNIMDFAKSYFTGAPPHDLLKADTPSPPFHYELAEYLRESTMDPWERKFAIAAPRSHAKLWCV